jgi:hypothetical protein
MYSGELGSHRWVLGEDLAIDWQGQNRGNMDLWDPSCNGNLGNGNAIDTDTMECGYMDNGVFDYLFLHFHTHYQRIGMKVL